MQKTRREFWPTELNALKIRDETNLLFTLHQTRQSNSSWWSRYFGQTTEFVSKSFKILGCNGTLTDGFLTQNFVGNFCHHSIGLRALTSI